ncbi:MAG TPA: carboxypeptidase-like regulatory domain-containing protein [Gemmata sp.]|jgi:hypothetical protein|nr:carboxypeptidase-like regulatory domain-containing protein [Gemmata sp.]
MDHFIVKPAIRLAGCFSLLGLLTLIGGCSKNPQSVDHAEVSGKVLIEGKPVPGGQVSFVAVNGGFAASGNIDENGNYQIKAPVGEVIITVNNSMLQPRRGAPSKGPPAPKELPHPKQSGVDEQPTKEQPMKGHWVSIPSRYTDSSSSDLKYTVKPGPQTYDIGLSATPSPPSGSPGS